MECFLWIVHYQLCFCCVNWKSKIVATAVESITLYWKMFMINQVNETVSSEPLVVSYLHEILYITCQYEKWGRRGCDRMVVGFTNYLHVCNQCLSPLMLWVRISIKARCTTLCDKVCQWLATGRWFSPGPPVSSTNKTDHHDITEILLKMALNTIKQTNKSIWKYSRRNIFLENNLKLYLS